MLAEPTLDFLGSTATQVVLPDEDSEDADKLESRLRRAAYCMAQLKCRDPLTGIMRTVSHPCREWRICPRCKKQRVKTIRERVERAVTAGPVRWLLTDDDHAKRLVRKYGKELVLRLPQANDKSTIFIATSDPIGTLINDKPPRWERVVETPEGQHISGSLGNLPAKDDTELVSIKQSIYAIEGLTDEQMAQADRKAIAATRDMNPQTPEELEKAITKRDQLYLGAAKKMGATVEFRRMIRTPVDVDLIRWKMTLPETIRQVKEANTKTVTMPKAYHPRPEYPKVSPEQAIKDREAYLNGW